MIYLRLFVTCLIHNKLYPPPNKHQTESNFNFIFSWLIWSEELNPHLFAFCPLQIIVCVDYCINQKPLTVKGKIGGLVAVWFYNSYGLLFITIGHPCTLREPTLFRPAASPTRKYCGWRRESSAVSLRPMFTNLSFPHILKKRHSITNYVDKP